MANVDLEQEDGMPNSYGAYGSDDEAAQRDIAQRQNLDLYARTPKKFQSAGDKALTAVQKFGSLPAMARLNEEAGARLYGKMTGNGDMVELLNGVPEQYHTSVLDEASKYGALAGYVRRDQILQNIETNSQFDDMSWYAQLGYGAAAFITDPLNVIGGLKVVQGANAATGLLRGAQQASIINAGVNGGRAWMASGLVSNTAKVSIWAGAGAAEGAISNLPQLAADHTYTARDYGLDIMFDSTLGVAFGTVATAAKPLFTTQNYQREIEQVQTKLQQDIQATADPLPPVRLPEEEVEDVGTAVTKANDMVTTLNNSEVQAQIDAVQVELDAVSKLSGDAPSSVTELPTDDDYIKDLKTEINQLYAAFEAEPANEVTDNKRLIREKLQDRYGELNALLDEKKAALGKSQVRQYADLNTINRISGKGFGAVAATVRGQFDGTGIGHLINNQTSLLKKDLPPEVRVEAEKLNADIIKLLATVPNGQVPKWLDDSVKQLTYTQKEFTTNNALELAINSSPLQAKETLTQYNDFLQRLDIWEGYDPQPVSTEDFFRDNQAWLNPDLDVDPDVLNMQSYISKELSMLRDVVELNKSLNMVDPEFRAQVERLNGLVTTRMEQKTMANTWRTPDEAQSYTLKDGTKVEVNQGMGLTHEDIKDIAKNVKDELIRMGYVPKTAEFAKRYATAFERAMIDARSAAPEQFKEYKDSKESWGKTVQLTAPDILKILQREGYQKGTDDYKVRFKELRSQGRTEVSDEVNRIGKRQSYEVGTISEGRDMLDRDDLAAAQNRYDGGDEAAILSGDMVDVNESSAGKMVAVVDEPDQGLLPTKFNVVTKKSAYKEPTVENLQRLRNSLNNSLTAKATKLSKTTNRTAFEVQDRLERIERALMNGRKKEAVQRAIASHDLQNILDVIKVSQTIADEIKVKEVSKPTPKSPTAKPAEPNPLSSALTPDEADSLDPMSGVPASKDAKAKMEAATKALDAKAAAKVGNSIINFVQSGKHAALKIALKPKNFTDRIGRLAASWVKDLGQRFVEHDLKSLNYVGYYLTEVGAGFGGKITRPNTAAIIRDAAYKNSVQNMVVDYVSTMDKYAQSKGAGAVQKMFAQQSAGQDSEIVAMFNKDVFAVINALQSGTSVPKVDKSVTDFVTVWKDYMDKNHEMLLEANIQGFTRDRKINYYMPQIWQTGKLTAAIKQHGYDKVVKVLKQGYLTSSANGKFAVPDHVAEDNAKGLIDWIKAQDKDTPYDQYMPTIDSRAQERRAINTQAEVDGLSVMDLLDTDVIANGIRYSNRIAGWVGLSKSTNGALTSLRDIEALKANIIEEGAAKGVDTTKQVQWYDDVINMLFGRPTRGGLEPELRMLKDLTALTRMGGLGTAQLIETGQVITRSALNLFSSNAVVGKVLKLGVTPGQAVDANAEQALMHELQSLSGITDGLEWLDRQSVHLDQHELASIGKVRQASLQVADTMTWRSWKAPASRLLGKTTGYNMVRRFQARLTQASFVSDVANHFKFGTGKMGNARMADVGLTDANGMNRELEQVFKQYVEFAPNRTITKLNIDKWPKKVREQFQYAMLRDEAQMVQRTHVGELPPWMNKPLMGLLFQFREMPMVAMNKQLRRNMAFADKEAVVGVMMNMAFAGLVRWGKFAALGGAAAAITGEDWQEPNGERMDAQKYVAQFGLYPDLYDLVLDTTDAVQDRDVHKVLNQVPVLGLMKDYHDTVRPPENRTQIDAAQGLVPLGNTAYGDNIFLWLNAQFGE